MVKQNKGLVAAIKDVQREHDIAVASAQVAETHYKEALEQEESRRVQVTTEALRKHADLERDNERYRTLYREASKEVAEISGDKEVLNTRHRDAARSLIGVIGITEFDTVDEMAFLAAAEIKRLNKELSKERERYRDWLEKKETELEGIRAGRRDASQILIDAIGALGPESVRETAERAVVRIVELREELKNTNNSVAYERRRVDIEENAFRKFRHDTELSQVKANTILRNRIEESEQLTRDLERWQTRHEAMRQIAINQRQKLMSFANDKSYNDNFREEVQGYLDYTPKFYMGCDQNPDKGFDLFAIIEDNRRLREKLGSVRAYLYGETQSLHSIVTKAQD